MESERRSTMSSLKGQLSNMEGSVKSMKTAVVVGSVLTVACLAAVFGVTILANEVSKETKVNNGTLTTRTGESVRVSSHSEDSLIEAAMNGAVLPNDMITVPFAHGELSLAVESVAKGEQGAIIAGGEYQIVVDFSVESAAIVMSAEMAEKHADLFGENEVTTVEEESVQESEEEEKSLSRSRSNQYYCYTRDYRLKHGYKYDTRCLCRYHCNRSYCAGCNTRSYYKHEGCKGYRARCGSSPWKLWKLVKEAWGIFSRCFEGAVKSFLPPGVKTIKDAKNIHDRVKKIDRVRKGINGALKTERHYKNWGTGNTALKAIGDSNLDYVEKNVRAGLNTGVDMIAQSVGKGNPFLGAAIGCIGYNATHYGVKAAMGATARSELKKYDTYVHRYPPRPTRRPRRYPVRRPAPSASY